MKVELVFTDTIMMVYRGIVNVSFLKSAKKLFKQQNWILQQNNDPKHTPLTFERILHQK